jgi:adenylosuccinate synthase
MNAQDFRGIQEAYMEVVENQQLDEADRIDKGLSPLVKRQVRNDRIRGEVSSRDPEAHTEPELEKSRRVMHNAMRGQKKPEAKSRPTGPGKYGAMNRRGMSVSDKFRKEVLKRGMKEEVDLYDIILSHLLDEGYADTQQAAEAIMVNMSEEWRDSIIG